MISWSSMAPDRTLPEIRSNRTPMTKYAIFFTLVNHPSFLRNKLIQHQCQTVRKPWVDVWKLRRVVHGDGQRRVHKNKGLIAKLALICKMLQENGL